VQIEKQKNSKFFNDCWFYFIFCKSPSVDSQHAVIEFNEQKDWFVLQDLDTTQGTSVNQCRIQNAAVRLSPGDVIKFGSHPTTYEFNISSQSQVIMCLMYVM